MRALFVVLLLANLIVLGWIMHTSGSNDERPQPKQLPGVETITLLSEREQPATDEPVEAGEPEPKTAEPVAVAQAVKEAQPEPEPAPAESVKPAVVVSDSCHTIGPFRDLDRLRVIIREIRDDVKEASFRTRQESEQTMFRIYLPPERNNAAAKATTRKLRQKGIKDSFIITDGDLLHGISLGYFRNKQSAYRLRDSISKKGFKPVIEPVFREVTIYWLDYRLDPDKAAEDLLKGLKLDKSVSRFDRACA